MLEGLDMSLEDIILKNKNSGLTATGGRGGVGGSRSFRGRGHGHGGRGLLESPSSSSGVGPTRRADDRVPFRTNPYPSSYAPPQALNVPQMVVGRPPTDSEAGTKLYISNLDSEVNNEDIKLLFSDVGELKRYSIHYDKSGRSKGTAEVVYMRHTDAVAAMERYKHMQLDGKPMRLELVGVNIAAPAPMLPMHMRILGNPMNSSQSAQGTIVGRGQDHGGYNAQWGSGNNAQRSSGRSRVRPQKVSAEDLDADLEKYRLERTHIK